MNTLTLNYSRTTTNLEVCRQIRAALPKLTAKGIDLIVVQYEAHRVRVYSNGHMHPYRLLNTERGESGGL